MDDQSLTIRKARKCVAEFVNERDWNQFHLPKNLSMAIAVEASELMEHFLWVDSVKSSELLAKKRQEIEDEVADIFIALLAFCNQTDINLAHSFEHKLKSIKKKYPADKVKGKPDKYTEYR